MQDLNDKITGNVLPASEWNQIPSEMQNVIEGLGINLSGGDLNQLGKAIAGYAANGTFYTDSGTPGSYVLSSIGSKQSPPSYSDGFKINFRTTNQNPSSIATVNVSMLGVKDIKLPGGTDVRPGQISGVVECIFDAANDWFELQVPPVSIISHSVLSDAIADNNLNIGDFVSVEDYATGNNSGVLFFSVVAGGSGPNDGGSYVDTDNGLQLKQNFQREFVSLKQFGAKGDGVADDTTQVAACLSVSKVVNIGQGRFLVSSINMGVCTKLFGLGNQSVLLTQVDADVLTLNNNDTDLFDFVIEGDYDRDGGAGSPSTKTNQTGIRNAGWYGQRISNVRGFKLGGYFYRVSRLFADSSTVTRMNQVHDCSAHQCRGGLWFDDRGEYVTVTGGIYEENDTGVLVGAGNVLFNGCNINQNGNNVHLIAGINDGHGIFSGCNLNHADIWNIYADGIENGMTFDGCHIYEGNIWLLNSKGIHITNGDLDVASILFEGCTGLIKNNLMPGAYGNVITNDRNGNNSLVRWIDNYDLEGQKYGVYGPYNGGYSRAVLASSVAVTTDQDIIFQSSVDRITNHNGFNYHSLYDNTTGIFTFRGIGSGMVSANLSINVLNVVDPETTNVWVRKNGVNYEAATKIVTGTTVRYILNATIPCDDIGDTINFHITTTDTGGVDISAADQRCQVEGL